jgi:hypothetical protein
MTGALYSFPHTSSYRELEQLHDFWSSSNTIRSIKSRRMRRAGHAARIREEKNGGRIRMETKGRPRRMWNDNIKMDLK